MPFGVSESQERPPNRGNNKEGHKIRDAMWIPRPGRAHLRSLEICPAEEPRGWGRGGPPA